MCKPSVTQHAFTCVGEHSALIILPRRFYHSVLRFKNANLRYHNNTWPHVHCFSQLVLVDRGVLRPGDYFVSGLLWGFVRSIYDEEGATLLKHAGETVALLYGTSERNCTTRRLYRIAPGYLFRSKISISWLFVFRTPRPEKQRAQHGVFCDSRLNICHSRVVCRASVYVAP